MRGGGGEVDCGGDGGLEEGGALGADLDAKAALGDAVPVVVVVVSGCSNSSERKRERCV